MSLVFGSFAVRLLEPDFRNVEAVGDGERHRHDDHLGVGALLRQVRVQNVLELS